MQASVGHGNESCFKYICCGLNFHSSSFITDSKVWAKAAACRLNSLCSICVPLGLISDHLVFVTELPVPVGFPGPGNLLLLEVSA